MGERGPGASRLREAARAAPAIVSHPWEQDRMPADEPQNPISNLHLSTMATSPN